MLDTQILCNHTNIIYLTFMVEYLVTKVKPHDISD